MNKAILTAILLVSIMMVGVDCLCKDTLYDCFDNQGNKVGQICAPNCVSGLSCKPCSSKNYGQLCRDHGLTTGDHAEKKDGYCS